MKKYRTGFFGGKFFPFTKGHLYCLQKLSDECEEGVCILFLNGKDEAEYTEKNGLKYEWLAQSDRIRRINSVCRFFPNIRFTTLYCDVIYSTGNVEEDCWDKETDFVRSVVGPVFDVVYSSEPGYDEYFKRAYPFAEHVLVDVERKTFPISATIVRDGGNEMHEKWCC